MITQRDQDKLITAAKNLARTGLLYKTTEEDSTVLLMFINEYNDRKIKIPESIANLIKENYSYNYKYDEFKQTSNKLPNELEEYIETLKVIKGDTIPFSKIARMYLDPLTNFLIEVEY
jgi:hypothetical protein